MLKILEHFYSLMSDQLIGGSNHYTFPKSVWGLTKSRKILWDAHPKGSFLGMSDSNRDHKTCL